MSKKNIKIDVVLNLDLKKEYLIRKLLGRRVCPCCNYAYNIVTIEEGEYSFPPLLPKKNPENCDECNVKLIERDDDKLEIIEKRQDLYNDMMKGILDFYEDKGLLCNFEPKKGLNDYQKMKNVAINHSRK